MKSDQLFADVPFERWFLQLLRTTFMKMSTIIDLLHNYQTLVAFQMTMRKAVNEFNKVTSPRMKWCGISYGRSASILPCLNGRRHFHVCLISPPSLHFGHFLFVRKLYFIRLDFLSFFCQMTSIFSFIYYFCPASNTWDDRFCNPRNELKCRWRIDFTYIYTHIHT